MPESDPPLILEPDDLEELLHTGGPLVVDLSKPATYMQAHVPGAVHLEYGQLLGANKPVMGLLPDAQDFSNALSAIGVSPDTHVVAYDDEGGGKAGRLLWTLETAGHRRLSLLNGGLHAWANEGHRLDDTRVEPGAAEYPVTFGQGPVADGDYILSRLGDATLALLDVRSAAEFSGAKRFAARGGHIPGAVHMEWIRAMDQQRNLRLKSADELNALLEPLGVTPDKEVIVYCQTHHRSAHTYVALKSLGFERLKGYHGAWSEWGNRADTPVE